MQKSIYSPRYQLLTRRLVSARHAAGLTQEQVAVRLNKPQSFVSKYESGERRLDIIELLEVSDCLALDVKDLIVTLQGGEL